MKKIEAVEIYNKFKTLGNAENAKAMAQYMKHHFSYFGIRAPERKEALKLYRERIRSLDADDLERLVRDLYSYEERELQYAAIDILASNKRKWSEDTIHLIEDLLGQKQWWDSVDALAGVIADFFLKYPIYLRPYSQKWNVSDDIWFNRISIIFQLRYRGDANWDLMQKYILTHIESQEFFIQKAQGWALRHYGKFYPEKVRTFINDHPGLSKLTVREGMKYIL